MLEENLDHKSHTIIFDAELKMFGLGMKSEELLINICYHGSFLKTLKGM